MSSVQSRRSARVSARFDLQSPYLAGVALMPVDDQPRGGSTAMFSLEPMPLLRFCEPMAAARALCVRAVSVNPVDYKIRQNRKPNADKAEVLGWDAVGIGWSEMPGSP